MLMMVYFQLNEDINLFLGDVLSLAVTPDGRHIVSGSSDLCIKIFDIEAKKEVHNFKNVHEGTVFVLYKSHNS